MFITILQLAPGSSFEELHRVTYSGHWNIQATAKFFAWDLSPDDQLIAPSICQKEQGCYLGIWNVIKPKEQLHCELGALGAKAKAIAFSPDGQLLAMGDSSGVLSIWEGDKESQMEPLLKDRSSDMTRELAE